MPARNQLETNLLTLFGLLFTKTTLADASGHVDSNLEPYRLWNDQPMKNLKYICFSLTIINFNTKTRGPNTPSI